jgi:amidase
MRPWPGRICSATEANAGLHRTGPPLSAPPHPTGDFGPWGGNLDFNEIVEGTTVYLPVIIPGGLLYLGDGHAAQRDGELSGNGLETSMDVEVPVDLCPVIRFRRLGSNLPLT